MLRAVFIVLLLALLPAQARAEARIALLIGNQAYTPKVGLLKNPHEDVTLIGAALKRLGFEVTILKDADYRAMDVAIKRFITDVRTKGKGAISFFYYSGHGAANPDTQINYLIPVDVADPNDGNLWYQSFQQNDLIDKLSKQAPNATHYVVFDACRNELNLSGPAAKAVGVEKGFVPVPQTPGLLIAYATAQGKTATDVGDNGGPYARALAEEIVKPGIEAITMFRNVQIRVKEDIGQDPWLSFPALPEVYLAGRGEDLKKQQTAVPTPPAPPTPQRTQDKSGGAFDGNWQIQRYDAPGCHDPQASFSLTISNDAVLSDTEGPTGRVDKEGKISFSLPSRWIKGTRVRYSGQLTADSGRGRFSNVNGRCAGSFAAMRQ